jgi:hypothetical protein
MNEAQAERLIVAVERIAAALERNRSPGTASAEPDNQMLSTAQVAERLRLSENKVLDMLARGDLRGR